MKELSKPLSKNFDIGHYTGMEVEHGGDVFSNVYGHGGISGKNQGVQNWNEKVNDSMGGLRQKAL
jgi:hypothetical protein